MISDLLHVEASTKTCEAIYQTSYLKKENQGANKFQLIAGCPKKTATFLQLLKETAMRCGEAKRLKWTDIDFQRRLITLNDPEKNGLPRLWNNPTSKLLDMLNALPKESEYVFGSS